MRILAVTLLTLIFIQNGLSQEEHYRIMFYNVENLFDTYNDSLKADDDFTPGGNLHWTSGRLKSKINNLSKVIIAAGEFRPPVIIGLCEIENRLVLNRLIYETPLKEFDYKAVHFESPDQRGIDVALIYRGRYVRVVQASAIRIKKDNLSTRDILFFKAKIEDDTVHIFINHWPSRSAGQLETESLRMAAALTLRHAVDSLFSINSSAQIIIMGDLNDEPFDESVTDGLSALKPLTEIQPGFLYNLSVAPKGPVRGTLKYQGEWNVFDQVIVSGTLLKNEGLKIRSDGYRIFYNLAMLEEDKTFNGVKPFRTYRGFRYAGGFSDHLPVYVDIISHCEPDSCGRSNLTYSSFLSNAPRSGFPSAFLRFPSKSLSR